jgi:hypothetical protein
MFFEDFFLLRARRKVAVEVQSAFAHGNHVRFLEQTAQTPGAVCIPVAGRMGVNTGGGEQPLALSSSCWHNSSACSLPSTLVPVSTNWQTPAA